jgi:hypothetical protein
MTPRPVQIFFVNRSEPDFKRMSAALERLRPAFTAAFTLGEPIQQEAALITDAVTALDPAEADRVFRSILGQTAKTHSNPPPEMVRSGETAQILIADFSS